MSSFFFKKWEYFCFFLKKCFFYLISTKVKIRVFLQNARIPLERGKLTGIREFLFKIRGRGRGKFFAPELFYIYKKKLILPFAFSFLIFFVFNMNAAVLSRKNLLMKKKKRLKRILQNY